MMSYPDWIQRRIIHRKIIKDKIKQAGKTREIADKWVFVCIKLNNRFNSKIYCDKIDTQYLYLNELIKQVQKSPLMNSIESITKCIGKDKPFLEIILNSAPKKNITIY